jgi:hypothetical protein
VVVVVVVVVVVRLARLARLARLVLPVLVVLWHLRIPFAGTSAICLRSAAIATTTPVQSPRVLLLH